jgi:hypothetical protein
VKKRWRLADFHDLVAISTALVTNEELRDGDIKVHDTGVIQDGRNREVEEDNHATISIHVQKITGKH